MYMQEGGGGGGGGLVLPEGKTAVSCIILNRQSLLDDGDEYHKSGKPT